MKVTVTCYIIQVIETSVTKGCRLPALKARGNHTTHHAPCITCCLTYRPQTREEWIGTWSSPIASVPYVHFQFPLHLKLPRMNWTYKHAVLCATLNVANTRQLRACPSVETKARELTQTNCMFVPQRACIAILLNVFSSFTSFYVQYRLCARSEAPRVNWELEGRCEGWRRDHGLCRNVNTGNEKNYETVSVLSCPMTYLTYSDRNNSLI
jgi:hypothetical protein